MSGTHTRIETGSVIRYPYLWQWQAVRGETEGRKDRLRLWIVIDEVNIDTVGRSFYLKPEPPLGSFSRSFFGPVLRAMLAGRSVRKVDRT